MQRTPENGNVLNGEPKVASVRRHSSLSLLLDKKGRRLICNSVLSFTVFQDMALAVSNPREPESEEKPQKSLNEKQQVSAI